MDVPVEPSAVVPVAAVARLLAACDACGCAPRDLGALALLDLAVTAAEARRFKLDVSFQVSRDGRGRARWSVNDKGEEQALRARCRRVLPGLGVPAPLLDDFFALSPPGAVQTTVSVKWEEAGGAPDRVGLYYEELSRSPAGPALMGAVLDLGLGAADWGLPTAGEPAAVSLDLRAGVVVGARTYHWHCDAAAPAAVCLPGGLEELRRALPLHPRSGRRPFLLAERRLPGGGRSGSKLLWMTECHRPDDAVWAWAEVDRLVDGLSLPDSAPLQALKALRAGWDQPCFLHPDLVGIDVDAAGVATGMVIYVSLR